MSAVSKWFAPEERARRRTQRAERKQNWDHREAQLTALTSGFSTDHFVKLRVPEGGRTPMAMMLADTEGRYDTVITVTPGTASDQDQSFDVKAHIENPSSVRIPPGSSVFVGDQIEFRTDDVRRLVVAVDQVDGEIVREFPCRGPCGEEWTATLQAKRHLRLTWRVDRAPRDRGALEGTSTSPAVVLFAAANADCDLDLEEEIRAVEREFTAAKYREKIKFEQAVAVRPHDLITFVSNSRPAVVHFSGHGDVTGIVLRAEHGRPLEVTAEDLRDFFCGRDVELVVLNSCYSESQALLIAEEVNAVVGTTAEIDDEDARLFSAAFYRSLGDGHTVRTALKNGRDNVKMSGGSDVLKSLGDTDFRISKIRD